MAEEVKPNGHKLLLLVLTGVGVGLMSIGGFVATMFFRMLDNDARQTEAVFELSKNVAASTEMMEANTQVMRENLKHNRDANKWLEILAEFEKKGLWRYLEAPVVPAKKP